MADIFCGGIYLDVVLDVCKMETELKKILIEQLNRDGFAFLSKQGEHDLANILDILGKVILETDVKVRPESRAMVTSEKGLDFHTDHHKAKFILWYCYQQTDKGGESILIDAEQIWSELTPDEQNQLKNILLFEHKIFPDDKENYPLVKLDKKGKRKFYYSFWLVNDMDRHNPALIRFQDIIRKTEPNRITLKPSDILIVDNHRIFHGRTAIAGSKDRFLKRYWITSNN